MACVGRIGVWGWEGLGRSRWYVLMLREWGLIGEFGDADFGCDVATFKRGGTPMGRDGLRLVRS